MDLGSRRRPRPQQRRGQVAVVGRRGVAREFNRCNSFLLYAVDGIAGIVCSRLSGVRYADLEGFVGGYCRPLRSRRTFPFISLPFWFFPCFTPSAVHGCSIVIALSQLRRRHVHESPPSGDTVLCHRSQYAFLRCFRQTCGRSVVCSYPKLKRATL